MWGLFAKVQNFEQDVRGAVWGLLAKVQNFEQDVLLHRSFFWFVLLIFSFFRKGGFLIAGGFYNCGVDVVGGCAACRDCIGGPYTIPTGS